MSTRLFQIVAKMIIIAMLTLANVYRVQTNSVKNNTRKMTLDNSKMFSFLLYDPSGETKPINYEVHVNFEGPLSEIKSSDNSKTSSKSDNSKIFSKSDDSKTSSKSDNSKIFSKSDDSKTSKIDDSKTSSKIDNSTTSKSDNYNTSSKSDNYNTSSKSDNSNTSSESDNFSTYSKSDNSKISSKSNNFSASSTSEPINLNQNPIRGKPLKNVAQLEKIDPILSIDKSQREDDKGSDPNFENADVVKKTDDSTDDDEGSNTDITDAILAEETTTELFIPTRPHLSCCGRFKYTHVVNRTDNPETNQQTTKNHKRWKWPIPSFQLNYKVV